MSNKALNLTLRVWRQKKRESNGEFVDYKVSNISVDSSFLEMIDVLNEQLIEKGEEPVAFDHDCREGICGMCSMTINGVPHGKGRLQATCQLHMRHFDDGETITVEPFRGKPFPIIKDLVVDRTALDIIMQSGGYMTQRVGTAEDANAIPIPKPSLEKAMDAASCIGCGACVAACPNASAMLFTGAKVSHLNLLPQGQPERYSRAINMVNTMDGLGFGNCTNIGECEAACPKGISMDFIAMLNRDYAVGSVKKFFTGVA